jgi:hypothetical protein
MTGNQTGLMPANLITLAHFIGFSDNEFGEFGRRYWHRH